MEKSCCQFQLILYKKDNSSYKLVYYKLSELPKICNNLHGIQFCFELMWFTYLLDCIPFWIQLPFHPCQNQNESRPHCLMRHDWEELNHRNTFPSWVMYLKHHHKWSKNPSYQKISCCFFLIWQLQKFSTYPQLECASRLKDKKLISIFCPNCAWISQVKSRLLS